MKETHMHGVFTQNEKLFTVNPAACKGKKVYNERLFNQKGIEYRSWNPYRSKLAAALIKGVDIPIKQDFKVLYLGAAMGTTVSHMADIVTKGVVYAVEHTPLAMKSLLNFIS